MFILALLAATAAMAPGAVSGSVTYHNGYGEPRGDSKATVAMIPFDDPTIVARLSVSEKGLLSVGLVPPSVGGGYASTDGFGHYKIINLKPGTYLALATTQTSYSSVGSSSRKYCSDKLPGIIDPPTAGGMAVRCSIVKVYPGQESEQGFQLGD